MENYTITKDQILAIEKVGGADVSLYLKETFPEVFKTELETGKWYKGSVDFQSLIFITEHKQESYYNSIFYYGFLRNKFQTGEIANLDHEKSLIEATPEEVESALIAEAKKRGYKQGITCAFGKGAYNRMIRENEIRWVPDWQDKGALCMGMNVIFTQGNWAEIIPQEKTVVPMEKSLKIIAGEKYICRKDLVFCTGNIDFTRGNVYHSEIDGNLINNLNQSHDLSGNLAYKHFLHLPK